MGRDSDMSTNQRVQELITDLNSLDTNIRFEAREALIAIGSGAVAPLLGTLKSDEIRQSADAVSVLGTIGNEEAIPYLLEMRLHPNVLMRINSAEALGKLGDEQIKDYLIDWLNTESDILVQIELAKSLVEIGGKTVVDVLIATLTKTNSSTLRYLIIQWLGELGDRTTAKFIRPYRHDPDHHVREYADSALNQLNMLTKKKIRA